jgi:hypothetical protein
MARRDANCAHHLSAKRQDRPPGLCRGNVGELCAPRSGGRGPPRRCPGLLFGQLLCAMPATLCALLHPMKCAHRTMQLHVRSNSLVQLRIPFLQEVPLYKMSSIHK